MSNQVAKLKEELEKLQRLEKIRLMLPHKFGIKLNPWQKRFLEFPFNRKDIKTISYGKARAPVANECFVCAANQIGKSVTQIIKLITWATEPELWPKL